jgi:hypothetical protein
LVGDVGTGEPVGSKLALWRLLGPVLTEGLPDGMAIRTPDQRLRVFVSSTQGELAEERAAVSRAVSSLGLTPVLFELGARPHPPRELYRAYLAQSDIFIGLYWQRYGWIGPGLEISGLEDELELSRSLPRLLYVKAPALDREARLTAMLDRIKGEGGDSYRRFRTSRELGRLVRDDLAVLLSERFAATRRVGCSRGDAIGSDPAQPSAPAGGDHVAHRAGGRHRRGGRPARAARRADGHAHRPRRDRQDPAGGGCR